MPVALLLLPLLAIAEPLMVAVGPDAAVAVYADGPIDAPPVVLVPGLSGCAYGFRKLVPLLQGQGHRTLVIEPLGLGMSDRVKGADYCLSAQAARLAKVLDEQGVVGALVACQGISAGMVFRLALVRPDLVSGILSIEGGPVESVGTAKVETSLKLAKVVVKLGGGSVIRDRYEADLKKASGDDSWVDRRTVGYYFRGANRDLSGSLDAFIAMAEQPEPVALTPLLGGIAVPVAVMLGGAEHEGSMDAHEIEILRSGLRDVTFTTVPGAGHFLYEEQPAVVAAAIAELAARVGARQR